MDSKEQLKEQMDDLLQTIEDLKLDAKEAYSAGEENLGDRYLKQVSSLEGILSRLETKKDKCFDGQKNFNDEILKSLELINKRLTELIQIQKKVSMGFDYINAVELAQLLGESIKTVYNRVGNKQIPYYKPGGKILLFKLGEVHEWIKAGRFSSMEEIKQKI